jgi:polysaccharide biosynthesis/export protein
MLGLKTFRVWFGVILLTLAISGEALSAQEQRSTALADYRIGIGDVLQIDVWKEPEITRTIPVRPDGSIGLPLINDVKVSGLSAMELAELIREKLKDLIPNPQVTVTVTGIHGTNFPTISAPARPPKVSPPPLSPDLKQKCCVA